MLKKTIKYTDFNGDEREEDFYFNITEAEMHRMELAVEGGLHEKLDRVLKTRNVPELMEFFENLIKTSYGEKSPDGRRFVKSEELSKEFEQTEAYSVLYMELLTDADAAADFLIGIVPEKYKASAIEEKKKLSASK